MKKLILLFTALIALFAAIPATAAQVRVYVADINAIGPQNRDEMKATIQSLLASRLSTGNTIAVGTPGEADITITGTYVAVGRIFSVDAVARNSAGKVLTRAFVQGESQDELIPAIGKLAEKLSVELTAPAQVSPVGAPVAPSPSSAPTDIIKASPSKPAGDFIKPAEYEKNGTSGWVSKRLNGAANLLATGRSRADGTREIFLAGDRHLSYYLQSTEMKLVSEIELKSNEKILSVDTVEVTPERLDIYLTVIRNDELASKVLQVADGKLSVVADNLPWFFRSISLAGGPKKAYAQGLGRDNDFYGDVMEVTRTGASISLANPITLPRFGNIYSFNRLRDQDGKPLTVVINPDGYLIAYDADNKELWRSNDKFGGSELYFQREDLVNVRVTGDRFRWVFMNQRIQVTTKGDVLVGKNDGFWVLGNARSYKKGAVYCLSWNGSSLDEKWHTRDTQNYMPDYTYDETRNELLMLQTVQRPGSSSRGASSLSIKKVE